MKTKFCLSLLTLTSVVVSSQTANAQTYQPTNRAPVADSTLGTQVSGNGNNFNITGGVNKGRTLFHSFTDFSVPTNGQANFLNPVGNRDIITRVTGNLFSDINGTVNTNGANFFLINPNGIVFGTNARLNVGKAFVGSTANSIDLVDAGGRTITFGTNASGDAPLLSVAPNVLFDVSRLNMGGGNGQISNFGTLQTTNLNQYIGLIGGNVTMNGGGINALGGRVEVGGLSAFGSVTLGVDGNNLTMQFPTNVARGDVSLTNGSRILVSGDGGGDIAITARNLEILGGSSLLGGIYPDLGSPEAVAGDIKLNATGEIVIAANSGISNNVGLNSKGKGGNIDIDAGSLSLQDGAQLSTATLGQGNAGNVTVTAKDAVIVSNSSMFSTVEVEAVGRGGNVNINAGSFSLQDAALVESSAYGQGDAGNVTVKVSGAVNIAGTKDGSSIAIDSVVNEGAVGKGGNITIDAGSFSLQDGALLIASTYGQGDAGDITIKVNGAVNIAGTKDGSSLAINSVVNEGAVGKGGNITIDAGSFSLQDGALLVASTYGQGDAGDVTVRVNGAVNITGRKDGSSLAISSDVNEGAVGKGGNIAIDAGSFSLQDGAALSTGTFGQGNAGNIIINASSFLLQNGALLSTGTFGQGDAGNVTVNVTGAVDFAGANTDKISSGILSTVKEGAVGKGGDVTINASSLSLQDGADLLTATLGQGDAGNVTVNVTGAVNIAGGGIDSSNFSNNVNSETVWNGGNITIKAGSLLFQDGARLSTSTYGQGTAGNVTVTAKDTISVTSNSSISSTVEAGGVGKGGSIDINAGSLSLRDGAQLKTSTISALDNQPAGQGDAGNITVKVTGTIDIGGVKDVPVGLFSNVETGTKGNAGNITIDTSSFSLRDGAEINTTTFGQGNAGTIKVNATDFVTISGKVGTFPSGLFVTSASETGTAGDIIVTAPRITLDNGGLIASESFVGNGGNISIGGQFKDESGFTPGSKIDPGNFTAANLLLLRRGGNISTNVGGTAQQGGSGGNININSDLIVAIPKENSDISANAVKGRGGNVKIDSQGLFGIQFRPQATANSDITASSEFGQNGNVNIDTPGTDPGRDSTELPNATTDASNQISQVCSANNRQNKLTVTGRGGLPPNANDPLTSDVVWQDARAASSQPAVSSAPNNSATLPPPAVGWVFDGKGKVTLVAAVTPGQPTGTRVACPQGVGK
jgi:filamentous hemagglutinin family protein